MRSRSSRFSEPRSASYDHLMSSTLGMNLMTKPPLSEAETVAMLERMCVDLRFATGATARTVASGQLLAPWSGSWAWPFHLWTRSARNLLRQWKIVPVLLIRDALENLNAYHREQRLHSMRAETISFTLGQYLRQVRYFGTK